MNNYNAFEKNILTSKSFVITGLSSFLRLLLVDKILKLPLSKSPSHAELISESIVERDVGEMLKQVQHDVSKRKLLFAESSNPPCHPEFISESIVKRDAGEMLKQVQHDDSQRKLLFAESSNPPCHPEFISGSIVERNAGEMLKQVQHDVSKRKLLFITASEQNCLKYQNDFEKAFALDCEILPFQNVSMYEGIEPNLYDYTKQLEVLNSNQDLILAPVKSLLEKFPDKNFIEKNSIDLKVGDTVDIMNLAQTLVNLGYKRVTMVSDIGEFSVRGDIIDIFSLSENPLRIELWGDEITDLRLFNNQTQKSIQKIGDFSVLPIIKPESGLVSVLDYLNDYILVFDEMSEIYTKYEFIDEEFKKQIDNKVLHFTTEDFHQKIAGFVKIGLNNFIDSEFSEIVEFESYTAPKFNAKIEDIITFIKSKPNYSLIIATDYKARVQELLADYGIFSDNKACLPEFISKSVVERGADEMLKQVQHDSGSSSESPHHPEFISGSHPIANDKCEVSPIQSIQYIDNLACSGCVIDDFKIILLTDKELFNKRSKEITASKRSYLKETPEFIESINDIKPEEYVVHSVHGIGIYKGLTQQEIDGQFKDYLTIEYANKDKLHMPAEQINLLCRYRGSGALKPKLSRMGGNDWSSTKTKVKKEVEEIAYDLLRLYASRKVAQGIAFEPDSAWQVELEDAFEYIETPDQMKSIEQIKSDMESSSPMDRLICGDVGFGKTEVAIRAIFKAITSGKQVAVIVPTTILATQHYQTISERFKPFGMNVGILSRFCSTKEKKETLKNLALGQCDVIIATHRLLQKDVIFKDLGLLVIDEEHKFGVNHKEKIKKLRENIDIISMSATPIPRTLYMSLSGIKDMSVINTPPKNRLPIKTHVGEFNEEILKKAINHEIDRGGQVFYLYNRVESIEEFKLQLQRACPNARIAIGHGKMDGNTLEKVILDFSEKEYDILLCTTIIENGIDIPNANTIIIHNADRFGLAQMYQLRGRVGRCERQAYCYCFYTKNKEITKEASERLKSIKEFTTLGSGYQIAMRDVEIRGVGNILGTKQHGHMINVGFDTYCQLLEETVQELQGEPIEKTPATIVDINITAYIPDEWVGSVEQKMIEYKRLADVKSQIELDYIVSEWKDRFSKAPECVENLINLIRVRLSATSAKITSVRETTQNIRIYTPYTQLEWNIIQKTLPKEIAKHIKFTIAPKSCTEGTSIILLDNRYMNFDEVFNKLTDLFYYIYKVKSEY